MLKIATLAKLEYVKKQNMKQILIFALLLSFSKTILAQEIKTVSLLTEKQNAEWILKFKSFNSNELKLEFIKEKIQFDSKFNARIGTCVIEKDRNHKDYKGEDYYYECKVLFLLKLDKKHYTLGIDVLNQIKQNDLNDITIIESDMNLLGFCGNVTIEINDKKLKRKIKNVL